MQVLANKSVAATSSCKGLIEMSLPKLALLNAKSVFIFLTATWPLNEAAQNKKFHFLPRQQSVTNTVFS